MNKEVFNHIYFSYSILVWIIIFLCGAYKLPSWIIKPLPQWLKRSIIVLTKLYFQVTQSLEGLG